MGSGVERTRSVPMRASFRAARLLSTRVYVSISQQYMSWDGLTGNGLLDRDGELALGNQLVQVKTKIVQNFQRQITQRHIRLLECFAGVTRCNCQAEIFAYFLKHVRSRNDGLGG